ncbi:hypothetical protein GCM10010193_43320 [Kitasatospora atroaurantiaca]|uniref:Uncharacterized protein n=1 Tax=Kitasatospora atroaurantiaca TaxID=285545 RepID=A0A561ETQ9_9ACTN|nr:hypothetical protein [Kitasatospora atroaurantiaca]TWE19000.1 hypothetical protein FB465_4101 [Kitasatospora atroaurantiaca]
MSTAQIHPTVRKASRPPVVSGSTATAGPRRRTPISHAVRNVGIMLDTAARVLLLGRDGVKL